MMTGLFLVDSVDVFTSYGVYVVEGGYDGLFNLPPMKKPVFVDWHEYDGVELMSSFSNYLDTRTFRIDFACRNGMAAHNQFIGMLYSNTHTYTLPKLGYSKSLRILGESSMTFEGDLVKFSVEFADDAPLSGYSYLAPVSSLAVDNTYQLDSIPLSQYGIRVLEGTQAEILKVAEIKTNMVRNVSVSAGAIAGLTPIKKQAKQVRLNLLITADNANGFWRNWNALAYNLTENGTRTLTVNGTDYDCYYNQCSVRRAIIDATNIWIEFTLTLTFTYQ